METVDMSRYVRTGAGANGESFDCLDDPNLMLKLYNASYPVQPVIDELEIARKVYDLGIPSPEPGHMVEVDGRLGIKFRRIVGKRSFSRALADEPERVEEYAREFARCGKKLHSTVCPENMFPNQKKEYLAFLDENKELSDEEKAKFRRFILSMPDTVTAVHGDFHIGNLLTTLPKGAPMSQEHDLYYIDMGYFAQGCPLLDLGMLDCVCNHTDDEFRFKEMHIRYDLSHKFWEYFKDEYFFGPEKMGEKWFGKDVKPEDIDELMLPYSAVKVLLIAFNAGFIPESYHPLIKKALKLMA